MMILAVHDLHRSYNDVTGGPAAAATSSRLKRAVTAPKKSRLRVAKLELILIVVVLGVAAAIYVGSFRSHKPPGGVGCQTPPAPRYVRYIRQQVNVKSWKPHNYQTPCQIFHTSAT